MRETALETSLRTGGCLPAFRRSFCENLSNFWLILGDLGPFARKLRRSGPDLRNLHPNGPVARSMAQKVGRFVTKMPKEIKTDRTRNSNQKTRS